MTKLVYRGTIVSPPEPPPEEAKSPGGAYWEDVLIAVKPKTSAGETLLYAAAWPQLVSLPPLSTGDRVRVTVALDGHTLDDSVVEHDENTVALVVHIHRCRVTGPWLRAMSAPWRRLVASLTRLAAPSSSLRGV